MSVRVASHAGSWYAGRGDELKKQLDRWLQDVKKSDELQPSCGLIAPHAGYSYSGPTAAYAYRYMDPSRIKRIFVLGPSHHYYLTGCALSKHSAYATPLGNLEIDTDVVKELHSSGLFEYMSEEVDEDEHSLEMQMPYIYKVMEQASKSYKIVPVLVGNLSPKKEDVYGSLFSRYLNDPSTFFVISSDFCHWGSRFRYTYYDPSFGEIYQSIEALDRQGMQEIESLSPENFQNYQAKFNNTICGRHPIAVLLNALKASSAASQASIQFVRYAQSSPCRCQADSSVSYASAVVKTAG
ncbi:hypothetical protein GUITHDRAFT_71667 [Guillardia theta CCMP2712]|uniref:Protein MEMO1 n=1 Tax=Guillardia theta (strain CCMP2712) TaxID=905079 RepID=L1J9Q3_GUITC|nr:hypothetical protein GUITHDRAFT_71667 [Guillardia theta CCMP2712]EKX45067.1 hypothetical protein GUITHDRAFT_71667 [Guillardia theta CCMP2712]|eukprot:XP_005832047.1 hypothetical protein GUITHDRAFT_71667 [Guillardia theta CCMP2712]